MAATKVAMARKNIHELIDGKLGYQPGYTGGLVLNLGVSKSFSIQPEILYSQEGVRIKNGDDYLASQVDLVTIPILLKLAMGGSGLKFFISLFALTNVSFITAVLGGKVSIKGLDESFTEIEISSGSQPGEVFTVSTISKESSPSPNTCRCCPVWIPGGIFILTLRFTCDFPWPLHSVHLLASRSGIWPDP